MTFSPEWDEVYRESRHLSVWPWSELVSYVYRYANPEDGYRRVLEFGCGAGANIPFFLKLDVEYFGIEGSPYIVAFLHEKYPKLKHHIFVGDFTKALPFEGSFDLIVDRASLTHNTSAAVSRALGLSVGCLRPGGKMIGIDWFAADHSDSVNGEPLDTWTRARILKGQFKGLGAVHFADHDHIVGLLHGVGFAIERLEHKQIDTVVPAKGGRLATWNFVAVKP
jgi:SAM-dependent methyltransferase